MCDYSLQHVATRAAKVDDLLVTTKFNNSITRGFAEAGEPNVAVCILPGTELAFEREVECDHALGFFPTRKLRERDAAEHDRPSPWPGRGMFGRGIGRPYPPANSCLTPSRRGVPQVMGAIALCWRSRKPPPCATGDGRERLARSSSRWTRREQAARWNDRHQQGQ